MWRTISFAALIGVMGVGIGFQSSDAVAQTTEPVEVSDSIAPEWLPQDGRPPWSNTDDADVETPTGWRPGDGRPDWAASSDTDIDVEASAVRPDWAGRPAWAGQPDDPRGLRDQRPFEAQSLQAARGGVASGLENRGRGRR